MKAGLEGELTKEKEIQKICSEGGTRRINEETKIRKSALKAGLEGELADGFCGRIMDKERQKGFARRVSQANRTELVVVTYDIILEYMADARTAAGKGDTDEFRLSLKQAQRFLGEMMRSLDFHVELSLRLMQLYEYVQRQLVASEVRGENVNLDSAAGVIAGLRKSFHEIADRDDSGCVMENSQQIYAGLTYGRGVLNEADVNPDASKRGYLV